MSDIILRGFRPEHRALALLAVMSYDREHPDAASGMSGARTYDHWASEGVRLFVYRNRKGQTLAVCLATKKGSP